MWQFIRDRMRFQATRTFMRHLLTEADGESFDLLRVVALGFCVSFIVLSCWTVMKLHTAFDPSAFGTGAAALMAACGASLAMRARGEGKSAPDKEQQ